MKNIKNLVNNALASVRRWRWKRSAARYFDPAEDGLEVVAQDAMPPETATERLCEVGIRMTGSDRRMFQRARQRGLVPVRFARKPFGLETLRRFEGRPLATLLKWNHRAAKRRRGVQKKYEILVTLEGPQVEKAKKLLDQRAAALDLAIEITETIIKWRRSLATGCIMKPEAVGVLRNPLTGQQLIWTENLDTRALGPGERVRRTEFPRWVPLKISK